MSETARQHGRIQEKPSSGLHLTLTEPLAKPVDLFAPKERFRQGRFHLLVHFHGSAFILQDALRRTGDDWAGINVNLGSGSRVYREAFTDPGRFNALVTAAQAALAEKLQGAVTFDRVVLSGFSAGYGGVAAILSDPANYSRVDAVLLLDAIHASYVPEDKVLAEGGRIRQQDLQIFLDLAADVSRAESKKRFLITHSEIFPGTFVSTTEATDHLLETLRIKRMPVLRWGPLGMQQISDARRGHFRVLGFAGNTAPDHVDHLHAMAHFLDELLD
ncbi:MAG: hypothetical protein EHM23_22525 [Acidobacteria bacterium]|nr:MAG: hypothetical protein EHM23_22525 [Acidobacteriota bacterium]